MSSIKDVVVKRRFQRSIRLDTDLNEIDCLHGFVCPPTLSNALENLSKQANETGQGAFTWTGPFGGGKSSLAVILAALLNPPGQSRRLALQLTGTVGRQVVKALRPGRKGFRCVAVVGRKGPLPEQIAQALRRDGLIRRDLDTREDGGQNLLSVLQEIARRPRNAGLFLVIDELGKILEAAAHGRGDLHFLQELAELASRSDRRLLVLGILHQAFGEYTGRVAQRTRNEWMKVQGRFVDIPLATVAEEQLILLGGAIESKPPKSAYRSADQLAKVLESSRQLDPRSLSSRLAECWPLNGVTASLLGPISRRRFGQNQRSIFSFLNSAEPYGFQSFIASTDATSTYDPSLLWDYLRANLEPSILASPDGHRWSTAIEALERCEAKGGTREHLSVAKSIAIVDMFREYSGFPASKNILRGAVPDIPARRQADILRDLTNWSIIAYRRHLDAYSIHAGSDFDIEAAVAEERNAGLSLDPSELRRLADLKPIIAKRHYHQTGALRWIDVEIIAIDDVNLLPKRKRASTGCFGSLVVILSSKDISERESVNLVKAVSENAKHCLMLGLLPNTEEVVDLAEELVSLERLRLHRRELSGDAVARREVLAHINTTRQVLSTKLQEAVAEINWYAGGRRQNLTNLAAIHGYVSKIADRAFSKSPMIKNELLNRASPSSTAVAARRALMHAMVNKRGLPRLGIDGFPAEGGLCSSILEATECYRKEIEVSPRLGFYSPTSKDPGRLQGLWDAADQILEGSDRTPTALAAIYDKWRSPPYGVKDGLIPVLALSFILTRVDRIAIYLDGAFRPQIDDFLVDRIQQEPSAVLLRQINFDRLRARILRGISDTVADFSGNDAGTDEFVVARSLVALVNQLPGWTLRTSTISEDARRLRGIIRAAADPHRFLFDDLPAFTHGNESALSDVQINQIVASVKRGLAELVSAYDKMLDQLTELILFELGAASSKTGIDALHRRARTVLGLTGDFRLDAFATRLTTFNTDNESVEGIASLAANKPSKDWVDRDLDSARVEIADLAQRFNRAELYARVKGRMSTRYAMAVIIGRQESSETIMEEFALDHDKLKLSAELSASIDKLFSSSGYQRDVLMAALAQTGANLINSKGKGPARLKKAS